MNRTASLFVSLATAALGASACSVDTPSPTETVRLAVIGDAAHGGKLFVNNMAQEVTSSPAWSGDPDGTGTALITVNLGQNEVCWETTVSGLTLPATASHIHRADPGVRGPIVVTLSAPNASGQVTGCRSDADADVLRDILQNPGSYYVNVHTTDYPAGAIRSQMSR